MKAVCWYGSGDVRVETVPDPKILNPRDAIVRITLTAICGSDLHIYNGFIPAMKKGDILGHEFMGEVVEVGNEVKNLKKVTGSSFHLPYAAVPAFIARSREEDDNFLSIGYEAWEYEVAADRVLAAVKNSRTVLNGVPLEEISETPAT